MIGHNEVVFIPKYAARRFSLAAGPCECPYTKNFAEQCENCNTFWSLVTEALGDE